MLRQLGLTTTTRQMQWRSNSQRLCRSRDEGANAKNTRSFEVDSSHMNCVKSSEFGQVDLRSTWGHFSFKWGHISWPQRLAGLTTDQRIQTKQIKQRFKKNQRAFGGAHTARFSVYPVPVSGFYGRMFGSGKIDPGNISSKFNTVVRIKPP